MNKDPKQITKIQILKNNLTAGTLERTTDGCKIEFTPEFVNTHPKLTFNITTKYKIYNFKGAGLPPYFAGLLPEGLRLKSLIKKIKTSPDDLFSLLVASGAEAIGDIHFDTINQYDEPIIKIPDNFKSLKQQLKKGIDPGRNVLAGIQDKISADRISLPVIIKKRNKSYILKLSSDEFTDIITNEFICLEIARACGLNVTQGQIVADGNNQPGLLVERFDRQWIKSDKKWHRLHQEDACQFMDRYPADKYILSFQEIADRVAELATSPEIEILNLLRLKAFSYLVGNGDLHAKNISLYQTAENQPVKLTPAYDLICTALYGDQKMALLFVGKNQNLKKKNFTDFARRYHIPEKAILSMLTKLTSLFEKNYETIFLIPSARKKEKFLRTFFRDRLKDLG